MSERQLRRQLPKEGVVLPASSENGHLINQTIVQILVEKDTPEEVKELIKAELDYNRERLSILREHAEKHPDAIEERQGKRFRRTQYLFLMAFLPVLISAIYFMPTATALALCTLAMMITAGIVLNGRDRDGDSESLIKLIEKLLARRDT
jgi:hypothetical protein